ncbi:uncharacterized protein N7487_010388 [Penicillium crustosum]|uniref:uncharacterized protein n=1 Tax=Penicillium crustosum TaxID=36656 RepID=UPI0023906330|nr:uncharacterized protein N7487_010388 [Penicillium crustosum]KAJ5396085.1 hypothetical protein N7487_010388 [Penicillium crustosum]
MTAFVAGCFEPDMLRDPLRLVFVKIGTPLIAPGTCRLTELQNRNGVAGSPLLGHSISTEILQKPNLASQDPNND